MFLEHKIPMSSLDLDFPGMIETTLKNNSNMCFFNISRLVCHLFRQGDHYIYYLDLTNLPSTWGKSEPSFRQLFEEMSGVTETNSFPLQIKHVFRHWKLFFLEDAKRTPYI